MRKFVYAVAVLLALAPLAAIGPASAAVQHPAAAAVPPGQISNEYIESQQDGNVLSSAGCTTPDGCAEATSAEYDTYSTTGSWVIGSYTYREIKDNVSKDCLEWVSTSSGNIYYVMEAACAGTDRQLWRMPEEPSYAGQYQVINYYATTKLNHDACLWNTDPTYTGDNWVITVQDCNSAQPRAQRWQFTTNPN
jgi:hypothetical protein